MANANGKQSQDWTRLKKSEELKLALANKTGIPVEQLIVVVVGSDVTSSTWAHPKLAIQFAQWCSVDFALQVSDWIDELLVIGKVELIPQTQIPAYVENVKIADSIRHITDTLSDNPRLAQFLIDQTIDRCFGQKVLASAELPIKGVAEIAESMGLPVNHKNRSALGRYISSLGVHERVREDRICNGQIRTINCYRVTDAIKVDINAFFS
jgi:hypothetical protein